MSSVLAGRATRVSVADESAYAATNIAVHTPTQARSARPSLSAHGDAHLVAPHAHGVVADAVLAAVFPDGGGGGEGGGVGVAGRGVVGEVDPAGAAVDLGVEEVEEVALATPVPVEEDLPGEESSVDETAEALRGGFFHTGDIGRQDKDGFFYIVDRAKEMIVSGGENVYTGEVEAAIYEIPEVKEAAVFGIPDEKWGELVAAAVVLRPETDLSAEELKDYCKTRIASYKVPRHIEFMTEELPKSGSGKILKRVLREKYWTGHPRRV